MNKWGKRFWGDVAEREVALGGSAAIGVLTANGADVLHPDPQVWLTLVVVPLAVNFLKCVVVNAKAGSDVAPSASLAGVTSNKS